MDALIEYWRAHPPTHLVGRTIAIGLGARFGAGPSPALPSPAANDAAPDPQAVLSLIGQAEPVRYDPPKRGMPTGDLTDG